MGLRRHPLRDRRQLQRRPQSALQTGESSHLNFQLYYIIVRITGTWVLEDL
jgi:hypothetical protein